MNQSHIGRLIGLNQGSQVEMNVNFGLFPPLPEEAAAQGKRLKGAARGIARKKAMSAHALADLGQCLQAAPLSGKS
jgi:folate-dependent tRNA-U54 methylase TrmFO/GidA